MLPYYRSAATLAIVLLGSPSIAQEATDTGTSIVLDPITITGNWLSKPSDEKVLEHPGARSIVERKQFEEKGASDIREVLRQIPGVQVQDSNGTGGSDVSLNVGVRGLTARLSPRSTILMDGIPLAYAPYGQPQLSLAPLSLGNIQSVDVVRGAGSVRYGPQNVGGIINFVTRDIPDEFTAEASVGSQISSHGSNVKSTPNVFIGGTNADGFGGALLYSGTHGDGYRSSNDKTDIDDIMFKGKYAISDTDELALSLHHFEGSGRMPGGLTAEQYNDDPFQSTRSYDEFTGRRSDISLKYTHNDGVNNFELLTYYTDSFRGSHIEQEGSGANAGLRRLTAAPRSYTTFAIEPRYSRLFDSGSVVQEVSIGYRYLKETSSETASRTRYYDPNSDFDPEEAPSNIYQTSEGGTVAHALYIDDKIDYGNWTVTPGVRYEFITTHNDITNLSAGAVTSTLNPEVDAKELLPTLSVLYRLNDQWSVFANAGVSFGPQQYSQLASTTKGLHPETAKTYEIGTHFKGDDWSGELTLFNIDFDKELLLTRSIVGEGIWTDLGATRHRGVEAAARYDLGGLTPALDGLSVSATYAYTEATFQAGAFTGRDLPFYSRHVGSIGARYQYENWVFNADVFAQSKQRSPGSPDEGAKYVTDEDATGRLGDIPGYATVNLRLGYDAEKDKNNFKFAFGVKNLFDKQYFTRSTDNNGGKFVGQPRTFYLQASLAF
ncbi:TonB-dependent siderophore receptor [Phyllobacterium sp. YR531]|uniref:TonB-dependent receptor family protein n=1 Tax=Phyllobacterium sp. YR531 TaxID=1144343 RepID=UPI00026F872A|nr:TonB-dependent siderophore receptor [Phyllobacterium sp. YR531]EJN03598.1 TonB-dependent siderophore receptor [Phyllobacterium sp. YR531]